MICTTTSRRPGLCMAAAALLFLALAAAVWAQDGFVPLFDGVSLKGWTLAGRPRDAYSVRDGLLVCPAASHGNLFTEKEYADFVLRLEFKLTKGANNGVGIRA